MSKPFAVLDTECYRNYWLCKIRRLDTRQVRVFEIWKDRRLDVNKLRETLASVIIVTFNGRNYDMPMIGLALTGADTTILKRCSDFIIQGQMRPWDVERQFGFQTPQYNHIDLIEVVPGMVSLKVYMGRLHCPKLQDLPIEHDAEITETRRQQILSYNDNDLDGTEALLGKFRAQIDLRREMSAQYNTDLRSKSDAQIAEAVIKHELTQRGVYVSRPEVAARAFKYKFPKFLDNAGPIVREVMERVREADFVVEPSGKVKMPQQLSSAKIKIGRGAYTMGIGGLHSNEKRQAVVADEHTLIIDRDVASYYPAIIIETSLYPRHLGRDFLDVYRGIRDRRIEAKRAGDKTTADTLKIVLNGLFGKLGNVWSLVYSPDLLIQVTVTGQLALLMLIEWIEAAGIGVVSANTDGIVIKCPTGRYSDLGQVIERWEQATGFETEETRYKALYSRDVNSYIALKEKGGVKLKGDYAPPEPVASSWPSPHNQICVSAVCDYLEHGIPIDMTIDWCNDIREFVEIRNVTGGGKWREQYLGRAVRWYHSTDGDPILYCKTNKTGNHNKVPSTEGCRPLMQMDGTMPPDLDKQWYVDEAYRILGLIGFTPMGRQ